MNAQADTNIDIELVKHIAFLIRLGITDEEAESFTEQFRDIIAHFKSLDEVDVSGIPPATESSGLQDVMREDIVVPSMSREEFLANAPMREGNFVKIANVFNP